MWRHQGQGRLSQGLDGFLAGPPGRGGEGLEYHQKSPGLGTGDWSSHFNSSSCMTLNQSSPWLSLSFPMCAMRWLDQPIPPALTPCTQGPKRLPTLRKDILLRLKYQGRVFLLGYKHPRPETLPLDLGVDKEDDWIIPAENLQCLPTMFPIFHK